MLMNYSQRRLVNIQFDNLYSILNKRPEFQNLANNSEVKFDILHSKYCRYLTNQDYLNLPSHRTKIDDTITNKNTSADITNESEKLPDTQINNEHVASNLSQTSNQEELINDSISPSIRNSTKASISTKITAHKDNSIFDIPNSDSESTDFEIKEKTIQKSKPISNNITRKVRSSKSIRIKVPKIKIISNIQPVTKKSVPLKKKRKNLFNHPEVRKQFFHFNLRSYFNFRPWMKHQFKLTHDIFRKIEQAFIQPKLHNSTLRQSKPFLKRNLKYSRNSKANIQLFEKFVDDNRSMDFGLDGAFKDSNINPVNLPEKKVRKKNQLIFD